MVNWILLPQTSFTLSVGNWTTIKSHSLCFDVKLQFSALKPLKSTRAQLGHWPLGLRCFLLPATLSVFAIAITGDFSKASGEHPAERFRPDIRLESIIDAAASNVRWTLAGELFQFPGKRRTDRPRIGICVTSSAGVCGPNWGQTFLLAAQVFCVRRPCSCGPSSVVRLPPDALPADAHSNWQPKLGGVLPRGQCEVWLK